MAHGDGMAVAAAVRRLQPRHDLAGLGPGRRRGSGLVTCCAGLPTRGTGHVDAAVDGAAVRPASRTRAGCAAACACSLAPDRFAGTLTAAAGGRRRSPPAGAAPPPGDELDLRPLSDGGPGFVDVARPAPSAARSRRHRRPDPLGQPVPAQRPAATADGPPTSRPRRPAGCTCCRRRARPGAHHDVRARPAARRGAVEAGARRVVVGLGGSATNDGGAGLLAALGAGDRRRARGGWPGPRRGGAPATCRAAARSPPAARAVELVAATDVDARCSACTAPRASTARRRAPPRAGRQALEAALGHCVDVVAACCAAARPARRGGPVAPTGPGAGAAGGLGFGAARRSGAPGAPASRLVADAVGLRRAARRADLVVTGEGRSTSSRCAARSSAASPSGPMTRRRARGRRWPARSSVGRREAAAGRRGGLRRLAEHRRTCRRAAGRPRRRRSAARAARVAGAPGRRRRGAASA